MKLHQIATITALAVGCLGQTAGFAQHSGVTYKAHLTAVNPGKVGSPAEGDATFRVVGDKLEVHIRMKNVPPGIEHWEHFHGFPNGRPAACVDPAKDGNKDGYVDLIETEPVSGTTMVPFNDSPEKMVIPTHTYPRANSRGVFDYTKSIPLSELTHKFGQIYQGGQIDLNKRVIYVHGVASTSALPASVKSLGPIPSHVTLPIACGKIIRAGH